MRSGVALSLFVTLVIIAKCYAEKNICYKETAKTEFSYRKKVYGGWTRYIVWYPVTKKVVVKAKVCCEGWGDYVPDVGCRVRLPCLVTISQSASAYCSGQRDKVLQAKRLFYKLNTPKIGSDATRTPSDVLVPVLDQPAATVRVHDMFDPVQADWFNSYFLAMATGMRAIYQKAVTTFGVKQFTTTTEFMQMRDFFMAGVKGMNMPRIFYPSEYYLDVTTNAEWEEDRLFAARRLGGLNPNILEKVTRQTSGHGAQWSSLVKQLNPTFDWEAAVRAVTSKSLHESIDSGMVYVADYKLYRDISHVPDITDRNATDNRVLRRSTAPIALFAMKDTSGSGTQDPVMEQELYPAAIQYDYKTDASVYKPTDGAHWQLAKSQLEIADFLVAQVGYHLTHTHLSMERFCVGAYRHFSTHHPLGQLLHRHCVGTVGINSNGVPALLHEFQIIHTLFAIGHVGAVEIVNKMFLEEHWRDFDFPERLKRRGLDDKEKLPYFPYRDDGIVFYDAVHKFVEEYIDIYYKINNDVKNDQRLQDYVNELSTQGTKGADAGKGKINGFPSSLNTVDELVDVMTKIIFIPADHSSVNYPLPECAQFVPASPTKLYRDTSELLTPFQSLADSGVAAYQGMTMGNLASLHYDSYLDYGAKMLDPAAKKVVEKHYAVLTQVIQPEIEKKCQARLAKKLFAYPYFLPKFVTNSISS